MHGQAPGLETGGFSCERMHAGRRGMASLFFAAFDEVRRTVPWNRSSLLKMESRDVWLGIRDWGLGALSD